MRVADFDFELPEALIAQQPAPGRGDSRLLALAADAGSAEDLVFADLPRLLRPGDLLVVNDTRVVKARLEARKSTGGKVEVLVERALDARRFLAHVRAGRSPRRGARLLFAGGETAVVAGREADLFELELEAGAQLSDLMAAHGSVPLPPYIRRAPHAEDDSRYQTIFAEHEGAVAAPTAGLHFDDAMLARLTALGVAVQRITLHVGAGTFAPVRVEDVDAHVMHAERVSVGEELCTAVARVRAAGGRVVAVGTTCVRALESAALEDPNGGGVPVPFVGDTRLFIRPGFRFRVVDALITNFHLPRSTLLMLLCAFAGRERVLAAYRHAVAAGYRFFSYGDASFFERHEA